MCGLYANPVPIFPEGGQYLLSLGFVKPTLCRFRGMTVASRNVVCQGGCSENRRKAQSGRRDSCDSCPCPCT